MSVPPGNIPIRTMGIKSNKFINRNATKLCVDYRTFRWNRRNSEEFRHLKLLAYWPIYGILFFLLEAVRTPNRYFEMYCPLDDIIPFCELFAIPYFFWFVYLVGIHVYTLLYDIPAFKKLMRYIMVSWSAALVIFFLFPSIQNLRVDSFARDNILTDLVAFMYWLDSNTNVCPSLHVVGSFAVHFAARETKLYQKRGWRIFFYISTALICVSTVFLKQHSVIDLVVGILVSVITYNLVYCPHRSRIPKLQTRKNHLNSVSLP